MSDDSTLKTGHWQLLELHRDAADNLKCIIDGKDVTAGNPRDKLPFVFMFLFNNNKGQGFAKQDPFAGDIAALAIYRKELTEKERVKLRNYFADVYELK